MSLARLSAAGTALLLDVSGPGLPRVLHWGADLGDFGDLDDSTVRDIGRATTPAVPHSALDEPAVLTLLPVEADGWSGAAGLAGHRGGARAHPRLRLVDPVQVGQDLIRARARDQDCGLEVCIELRLSPHGVIEFRGQVTNVGEGTYDLAALRPLLPIPTRACEVLDTTGRWCKEAVPQRIPLGYGTWSRPTRRGRTGHDGPLFLTAGTPGFGFRRGEVWAVHLAWSGDSEYVAERLPETAAGHGGTLGAAELLRPGEIRLEPGETYSAPTALFAWSGGGLDGLARRLHRWQRARPSHPVRPRPVVLNTWEAVYFDHDLDKLRDLADVAGRIGVERFVLDDGWFRGRRDDTAGLGDWYVDESVWPQGLHPLVDHVRGLGMQIGIWVEPEMVNADSDVLREHPEWMLAPAAGVGPPAWRHQQVLDLANPAAWNYLLDRLDALVREYRLDCLKWDMNRDLHAAGSPPGFGPAVHAQTLRLYDLLDELRSRHPELEIESCASGGARVDLAILARTDRVWASDCNDPLERQQIQRWTTQVVAPELVGAHVGPPVAHTTHRASDLPMRLVTALFGHAGIEWDLTTAAAGELDQVAAWIGLYRELRPLLHSGDVVRGDLPCDDALLHGVVAADAQSAVYAYVRLTTSIAAHPGLVQLPGLDPALRYDVRVRREAGDAATVHVQPPPWMANGVVVPGSVLTSVGLAMPVLAPGAALVVQVTAC